MKKILKSFLGMLVVVITLSFLTSCLTQTPGVATLTYKKDAQDKMEYYFNEYKEVDYTVENYEIIVTLYEDSLVAIKKCNLEEEVDNVISTTRAKMDEVVKIDHVQVAKDNALANWASFKEEMLAKEAEYSAENFAIVKEYLEAGVATINGAVTVEGVNQAYDIAKEKVESVDDLATETLKTLEARKAEAIVALNEHFATFNEADYTAEGYAKLEGIVSDCTNSINACEQLSDIDDALAKAKTAMAEVKLRPLTVEEAKLQEVNAEIEVEGVVIGYGGNGTWSEIIIKSKTSMAMIGIKSTKTYDKGDVIRFTAKVAESDNQTETGKKYLADPADIEVVEKGFSTALDLESAIVVKTQEDLAKIGSGAEYVLYKFAPTNMYGNMYESGKDYSKAYYRVSFNKDASTLDEIRVDNGEGKLVSVGFRVNYIAKNLGDNWPTNWFGQTEYVAGGYPGHVFSGEVYAVYVGGNGYYVQFTILEAEHIIANEEMQNGRVKAYEDLETVFASYDEDKYIPENYQIIKDANTAAKQLIKDALSVEEMNQAVVDAKASMDKVEKIKTVKNVDLVIPAKTNYTQYEAIDLTDGKAIVVFDDNTTYEIELTSEHVSSFSTDVVGSAVVVLKVMFNEVEYTLEYNIEVAEAAAKPLTISEMKTKAAGEEALVEGIVVARCGNGTWQEFLVKDLNTMDIIGLRNNNGININTSCEVGDIIRLTAKVVESTNETEKGKLYLTLVEGLQIVSSNNAITYDLTQAVSVSSQDELAAFVVNGKDNAYKLVKLSGDIYANTYGDEFASMYFRFHFNAEATKLAQIKVDNETGTQVSAALRNSYVSKNIGAEWTNTVFGVSDVVSGTFPGIKFSGSIYVLFVGGNKYYAQFTILDASHIVKA